MAKPKIVERIIDEQKEEKRAVKFFSSMKDGFTFYMFNVDKKGEPEYITDADGNNKRKAGKYYSFQRVPVRDPNTGKASHTHGYCYFITSEELHGPMHKPIVEALTMSAKHPDSKIFTAEVWEKKHNPHYSSLKETKDALVNLSERNEFLEAEIAELRVRLGGKV